MNVLTNEQHAELMRFAFKQVCDKSDWKAPVDCLVPWDCANVYMQAITFMTGVVPEYERQANGLARLTCVGYRMGPCGDH